MSKPNLTDREREYCERAGVAPERFEAFRGVRTFDQYKAAVERLKKAERQTGNGQ